MGNTCSASVAHNQRDDEHRGARRGKPSRRGGPHQHRPSASSSSLGPTRAAPLAAAPVVVDLSPGAPTATHASAAAFNPFATPLLPTAQSGPAASPGIGALLQETGSTTATPDTSPAVESRLPQHRRHPSSSSRVVANTAAVLSLPAVPPLAVTTTHVPTLADSSFSTSSAAARPSRVSPRHVSTSRSAGRSSIASMSGATGQFNVVSGGGGSFGPRGRRVHRRQQSSARTASTSGRQFMTMSAFASSGGESGGGVADGSQPDWLSSGGS